MGVERGLELWTEVLTNGQDLRPTEAVVRELQDYSGLSPDEIRAIASSSSTTTQQKWDGADRSTPEGLRDFYNDVSNWVFGTLSYHARQAEEGGIPLPVIAADAVKHLKPGVHFDFGCGVGTASLLFHKLGWRVALGDISRPLLNFAAWRMQQRSIGARIIDLNEEALPSEAFDLITAFNTMAHVPSPRESIFELHRTLRNGGYLVFDIDNYRRSGNQWHLYKHHYPIIREIRGIGFKRRPRRGDLYIFEKTERSPFGRLAVLIADRLMHNGVTNALAVFGRKVRRRFTGRG